MGTNYIHKNKIIHRDLKPQNLLITNEGIMKIGDFGLARGYGIPVKNYTHEVVTLWYRPPDVLLGSKTYLTTVDVWSIGCIFAEMINGVALFDGINAQDQLKKIFKIRGTPSEKTYPEIINLPEWVGHEYEFYQTQDLHKICPRLDKDGIDLLNKFLQIDPSKRISIQDALEHPFLTSVKKTVYTTIYDSKVK